MAKNRKPRPSYHQGIYKPRYPEKNINQTPIEYRSQLEFEYMWRVEKSSNILKWGSETIWVPYYNKVKKRVCQYWVDLYVETKNQGIIIVEIKPEREIKAIKENKRPKATKKKKRSTLLYETKMWIINKSKWEAANDFAKKKGWKFMIVSEKHLKDNKVPFL
jgi:hypothetical protein